MLPYPVSAAVFPITDLMSAFEVPIRSPGKLLPSAELGAQNSTALCCYAICHFLVKHTTWSDFRSDHLCVKNEILEQLSEGG